MCFKFHYGPEGLCPMILVFGALMHPMRTAPCQIKLKIQRTLEDANQEIEEEHENRRICFSLRNPGGPMVVDILEILRDLP